MDGGMGIAHAVDDGVVARQVRRTFADVVAVDSIDLRAPTGQVTALIGPNGSGKTTLLLVLASLLVPDSGQVTVAGFDPVTASAAVRARTGWMPDVLGTWDALTCREVLTTTAMAYRVPRGQVSGRVAEMLDVVHLADLGDAPARVLSRGQKQRLGLARALVHDPEVLLLDEPASGLDPRSRIEMRVLLRGLADRGRTVLVSSHVLAELDEMADGAVFVDRGRTISVQSLAAASSARRTWRVRALDPAALATALTALGAVWTPSDTGDAEAGALVEVGSDLEAADLLTGLVRDGVRVVSSAPAGGALEQAYLELTAGGGERR